MTKLPQVFGTAICMAQLPHPHDKHLWIVLRKWNREEYAVHFYNSQAGGFHNGFYYRSLDEARVEYTKRVAKEYTRYFKAIEDGERHD